MPVILHEKPNAGRTIIEKFEAHGGSSGFAVVLLTPDDVGGPNRGDLRPRARQNVIGEMFWFAGKLGRGRICALKKGDLEIPTDFAGVVYTDIDDRGAWKADLLRELETAGYAVDWRKALARITGGGVPANAAPAAARASARSRRATRTASPPLCMLRTRRGRARDGAHDRLVIAATAVRRGRHVNGCETSRARSMAKAGPGLKFNELRSRQGRR